MLLPASEQRAAKIRTEAIPLADFSRLKFVVVLQWTFTAEDEPETQTPADEAPVEGIDPGAGES